MISINKNIVRMIEKIVYSYKIPVTSNGITNFLLTHPNYPDLISISDAFDEWKIDHAIVKIKLDQLKEVQVPFLAELKDFIDPLAFVTKVEDNNVYYETTKAKPKKKTIDQFKDIWNGIVIAVEPGKKSGEKDYKVKKREETILTIQKALIVILGILIFGFLSFNLFKIINNSIFYLILIQFVLAITGTAISIIIYTYNKGNAPVFVKNLCKGAAALDCNSILNSNVSKLFGIISWSQIGLIYFSGIIISLFFVVNNLNIIFGLAIINLLSLPYTFFSIYYQTVVAKKWCLLCTIIQGVLWLQFVAFYNITSYSPEIITTHTFLQLCLTFGFSVFIVLVTGFDYGNTLEITELKKEIYSLKHNPDIFKSMLSNSRNIGLESSGDFVLGNPEGAITFTIATNLFCSPCARAHKVIEEILEKHNDVKFQCIFVTPQDSKDKQEVIKYIGAIYSQLGSLKAQEALKLWFDLKDFDKIKVIFPITLEASQGDSFIYKNLLSCNSCKIEYTPTLFINGKLLPDIYQINNIPYWIPYLRQYYIN
jgi:uncharacterized membrane protein/thiol-disulfide isomerase/thioredoxin